VNERQITHSLAMASRQVRRVATQQVTTAQQMIFPFGPLAPVMASRLKINSKDMMSLPRPTFGPMDRSPSSRPVVDDAVASLMENAYGAHMSLHDATPTVQVLNNVFAKLEGHNPSGSVKDRPVLRCVDGMVESGLVKNGSTIALATSGSAGLALLRAQEILLSKGISINVKIFMPQAYTTKSTPSKIIKTEGVVVEDIEAANAAGAASPSRSLCPVDANFVDSLARMRVLAQENDWKILEQHYDDNNMLSHEGTALELLAQVPDLTDVVCTTGTGGTAAGLRKFLPAHVTVHARPAESGTIDGLTDVRRYDNFCRPEELEGYTQSAPFDPSRSAAQQTVLREEHNIVAGPSSGAAFYLAKEIAQDDASKRVAFISADGRHANIE